MPDAPVESSVGSTWRRVGISGTEERLPLRRSQLWEQPRPRELAVVVFRGDKPMESQGSASELVARLDREVDRIAGLITVTASEDGLVALVDSRESVSKVREELLRLAVPEEAFEVMVVGEVLVPYPIADERLERWFAETEAGGRSDVGVTVREPKLKMTPRGIGKVVLILVLGYFVLSTVGFLLLMLIDGFAG